MGYTARNYNNVMVVGLRDPYEEDATGLSQTDQRLCHGAVVAYLDGPKTKRIGRSIVLTGERRGSLDESGQIVRDGGRTMGGYILEQYSRIPQSAVVIGGDPTDIEEIFTLINKQNPDFFKPDGKTGLVTPRGQAETIAEIGSWALRCSTKHFVPLPLGNSFKEAESLLSTPK